MCRPCRAEQFEQQTSLHGHSGIANRSASSRDEHCPSPNSAEMLQETSRRLAAHVQGVALQTLRSIFIQIFIIHHSHLHESVPTMPDPFFLLQCVGTYVSYTSRTAS